MERPAFCFVFVSRRERVRSFLRRFRNSASRRRDGGDASGQGSLVRGDTCCEEARYVFVFECMSGERVAFSFVFCEKREKKRIRPAICSFLSNVRIHSHTRHRNQMPRVLPPPISFSTDAATHTYAYTQWTSLIQTRHP
jgi:hypothetical protein